MEQTEASGLQKAAPPLGEPDPQGWATQNRYRDLRLRYSKHGVAGRPRTRPPTLGREARREKKEQLFPLVCVVSVQEEYR